MSIPDLPRSVNHAKELVRAGRSAEGEALLRSRLKECADDDGARGFLLNALAWILKEQYRFDEALEASREAVEIAHHLGSALAVVKTLADRAEIYYFAFNNPKALRTLALAESFLGGQYGDDPLLRAQIAQVRGISYRGCGWWKAGAESLRRASEWCSDRRQWLHHAAADADLAALLLDQARSEGAEPVLLEEALSRIESARKIFEEFKDVRGLGQSDYHHLGLRAELAATRGDIAALWETHHRFRELHEQHEIEGTGVASLQMLWWQEVSRCLDAIASAGPDPRLLDLLEGRRRDLDKILRVAPRVAYLWRERAVIDKHLAEHGLAPPDEALEEATHALERAAALLHLQLQSYSDPQLRASRISSAAPLVQSLAETATFALRLSSPRLELAARLWSAVQICRARDRRDLLRDPGLHRLPLQTRTKALELLARIRCLHCILANQSADRRLAAARARRPAATAPSHPSSEEISFGYPEYGELVRRGSGALECELQRRKEQFSQLAAGGAHLRLAGEELTQEESFDLAALQAQLRPGEVVLDYLLGPSALHVAVIHCTGLDIVELPVPSMTELRRTVTELPSGPGRSSLRHILVLDPDLDPVPDAMQKCSTWLFPPVLVKHLTGIPARRIYIVPTGPLWRIPFPWLEAHGLLALQLWEVALAPSARFVGSAAKPTASLVHACVIGHPGTPPLESVGPEVDLVAEQLGCPRLFGSDATPSRVLAALSSADIVHFACHGTCDPISPLISCLHLEPDETHPDGYLLLQEILEIPLRARIVVLGACHTARSEGPLSFPESLAHVFLGAGAELVVASLWEAEDQECLEFSRDFYSALASDIEPISAFHRAQCASLKRRRISEPEEALTLGFQEISRLAPLIALSARPAPASPIPDGHRSLRPSV